MNKKVRLLLQIGTVVLFCLLFAAAVLYAKGVFDFTFINRPYEEGEYTHVTEEETTTTVSDEKSGKLNEKYISGNVAEGGVSEKTYAEAVENIPKKDKMIEEGYSKSNKVFNKENMILANVDIPVVPNVFSNETETVEKPLKVEGKKGGYTTVIQTITQAKPQLKLHRGFVLYDDKTYGHLVLDSDFNAILKDFDPKVYKPDYTILSNGYPTFTYEDGLFSFRNAIDGWSLVEIEKKEQNNIFIAADIPYYYLEAQRSDIVPYYYSKTKLWGYTDTVSTVIQPSYFNAYGQSDNGLSAVVTVDGEYKFIDETGKVKIEMHGTKKLADGKTVNFLLLPPDTYGIESLGFFYYDHGLTRVRYGSYEEKNGKNILTEDYTMLIDSEGKIFNMPTGYNLVYYSDGVAVVEKEGFYGLFDYTQRWIAKPLYTYASPFVEGVCVLTNQNGKTGLIDTYGNILLDFVFDYISMPSNGVIVAYEQENGWSMYQKMNLEPKEEETDSAESTSAKETKTETTKQK